MNMDDKELEMLKAKRLAEMQKNLAVQDYKENQEKESNHNNEKKLHRENRS